MIGEISPKRWINTTGLITINLETTKELIMTNIINSNKFLTWRHSKDIKVYQANVKIIPSRIITIFFRYSSRYLLTISLSENLWKSSEYEPIVYKSFSIDTGNGIWKLQNLIKNGLFRMEMFFRPRKKKEIMEFIKKMEQK